MHYPSIAVYNFLFLRRSKLLQQKWLQRIGPCQIAKKLSEQSQQTIIFKRLLEIVVKMREREKEKSLHQ